MYHCLSQWNAYVAAGQSRETLRQRLDEVPQELRPPVESHVRTVFALKSKAKNNK